MPQLAICVPEIITCRLQQESSGYVFFPHLRITENLTDGGFYVLQFIRQLGLRTICIVCRVMLLRGSVGSLHEMITFWHGAAERHKAWVS